MSKGHMKISILLPDLRGGGVERIRLVLAREFVRAGHKVEFVLMQARGELLQEASAEFSVVDLATPRMRKLPYAFVHYLRRSRPDVVLAAMWPLTVIAPFAARLSGHRCKILVSEHGILSAQYRNRGLLHGCLLRLSTALGYRLADGRVGVSTGVVRDMAMLAKLNPKDFETIHNPLSPRGEPGADDLGEAERLWGVPRGGRVLTVGTMKRVKNHPLLLRAFSRLDDPKARLMFVGQGEGRDALLALAQDLGVTDRIILAGFHPDPTPFYKTADLFVLSSDYEGFGNVIVESLACGTPVVSTDCPSGPAEILENGRYGDLVPVGDAETLSDAIMRALSAPKAPDTLRRRAEDFAPEIAARKYLSLLNLT